MNRFRVFRIVELCHFRERHSISYDGWAARVTLTVLLNFRTVVIDSEMMNADQQSG